jgi:hypothetical protein
MALNRDQLLTAIAPAIVIKDVDGIGSVRIRQISEREFRAIADDPAADKSTLLARMGIVSLVDDDDAPLLTAADLNALQAGAFGPVEAILSAVSQVNRIGGGEKNSVPTPVDASPSA